MSQSQTNGGQVVLITGASSGIGAATGRYLADKGNRVYAGARRLDRLRELSETAKPGSVIHPLQLDVTNANSISRAVETILKETGTIDVLVNNAGYGAMGPIEVIPMEEIVGMFETNFFGLVAMTKAVLPVMRERRSGTIVNVSSLAGRFGTPFSSVYNASKFAIEGLSEALRYELKPFGVRVVLIEPGYIQTEFGNVAEQILSRYYAAGQTAYDRYVQRVEQTVNHFRKRAARADEVAKTIYRAISSERPKLRYVVHPPMWGITALSKLAPQVLIEFLVTRTYGLDKR